jgi:hypothetical protein
MIRPRRGGYRVIVYAGIDPVTGHQRQIARQVKGKREAERLEARPRAEVADGRHRGTSAAPSRSCWTSTSPGGRPAASPSPPPPSTTTAPSSRPSSSRPSSSCGSPSSTHHPGPLLRPAAPPGPATTRPCSVPAGSGRSMPCCPARWAWPPAMGGSASTRRGWPGRRPPTAAHDKRPVPTPAEVRETLAAEQEDAAFGLFLRLCATIGLRAGEVCALRWCDLDLEAGELSVSGNVVHVSGLEHGHVRKGPSLRRWHRLQPCASAWATAACRSPASTPIA